MNVENFKGAIRDLARPNRFEVILSRVGNLQFYAKGTDVPSQSIDAMDVAYQGRIIKMPGDRPNPDWTITVYGQESYAIYTQFERWLAEMNGPETNIGAPAAQVKAEGYIHQLGRQNQVLKRWKMVGCFPIDLGTISMDWSNNSTPLEFTVTLATDYILPQP